MFGHCVGGSCCHQQHDVDGRGALDYVRFATFHIELNFRGMENWPTWDCRLIVTMTLRLLLKLLLRTKFCRLGNSSQKVTANEPARRAWQSFPTVWFLCAIGTLHYKFPLSPGGTPPVKRHWTNCSCKLYLFHCDLAWIWRRCTFVSSYSAKRSVVWWTSPFKLFIWSTTFSGLWDSRQKHRQSRLYQLQIIHLLFSSISIISLVLIISYSAGSCAVFLSGVHLF